MDKNQEFQIENSVLTKYTGNSEAVVIPDGVRIIGESAFEECYSVKSVTVSEGVEVIGDGAFAYCRGLREVRLPNSLIEIGECAFSRCKNLKRLVIPMGVKIIKARAFEQLVVQDKDGFLLLLCETSKPFLRLPKGWSKDWLGGLARKSIRVVWDCKI